MSESVTMDGFAPMVDLSQILELNGSIRADLDRREKTLVAKKDALTETLKNLSLDLHNIEQERIALRTTEEMYQRLLEAHARVTTQDSTSEQQRRARIGPQRYLMLASIRRHTELTLQQLQNLTGLEQRRIRDQMRSDEADGIVSQFAPGQFILTEKGENLLMRFEKYKQSRGEALPELGQTFADDAEEAEINDLI